MHNRDTATLLSTAKISVKVNFEAIECFYSRKKLFLVEDGHICIVTFSLMLYFLSML